MLNKRGDFTVHSTLTFGVLFLALLALPRCHSVGPVLLPSDAPCESACKILEHYECPEAQPSPGGKSCVQVCEVASKYGTQAECVVRASDSLDAIRTCGVECR
jgi:hypothetical protein